MSEKNEVIQLEGVPIQWLSTPEGRKKAQKIFSRNAYKLRKIIWFGEGAPHDWVLLKAAHPDHNESTSQRCSEASSEEQKR